MVKKIFLIFICILILLSSLSYVFAGSDEEYYIYLQQNSLLKSYENTVLNSLLNNGMETFPTQLITDLQSNPYVLIYPYSSSSSLYGYYLFLYSGSYSGTGTGSYTVDQSKNPNWTITTSYYTVNNAIQYIVNKNSGYIISRTTNNTVNVPAVVWKNVPDFAPVLTEISKTGAVSDTEQITDAINSNTEVLQSTNSSLDNLNNFMQEDISSDNDTSMNFSQFNNPYDNSLSQIYNAIVNGITGNAQNISFTFLGHNVTIPADLVHDGLQSAGFNWLVNLASAFWLCLFALIIIRDVIHYVEAISEGNIEKTDTNNLFTRIM